MPSVDEMSRPQIFGYSVALIMGEAFDMRKLLEASSVIGLPFSYGSNGERDAMIAAFDVYKALRSAGS